MINIVNYTTKLSWEFVVYVCYGEQGDSDSGILIHASTGCQPYRCNFICYCLVLFT